MTPGKITGDITLYAIFYASIYFNGDGTYEGWEDGITLMPFENYTTRAAIGSSLTTAFCFKEGYNVYWTDGNISVKPEKDYKVSQSITLKVKTVEKTLDECYENGSYDVYTANQLDSVRNKTSEMKKISVRVVDDITVNNWTPIPEFNGSFNTATDKKITINGFSNYGSNVGFIAINYGYLSLNIQANVTISGNYAGIIVGHNKSTGYLMNCSTFGSINSTALYTGGVVGCNQGSLMYPINNATITASKNVGGVIGYQKVGDGSYRAIIKTLLIMEK